MDLHVYRNSQDRWHDLKAAAQKRGAVLASNALTIAELIQRLTPEINAATPAQRLALIDGSAGGGGPVRYSYDAIAELKAARVRPSELRQAGVAHLDSLAAHLDSYDRFLSRHGLTDPQDRVWIAAGRVVEGPQWIRQFERVVLHAIYDLNDAEFALLHNLIEQLPDGGTVMMFNSTANIKPTQFAEWTWKRFVQDDSLGDKTFPDFFRPSSPARDLLERLFVFEAPATQITEPLRPNSALRVIQCSGRYREIEFIGSRIAELLARGADPGEIAVVVRHIDTYGEMIEDVFTRYGIQHVFETGVPLLRIPFIKYWVALLDLVAGERPRDAMARVLASAYFQPRLTPLLDPERVLAQIGYIDRRHLKASALAARRSSSLTSALESFERFLDELEQASLRPLQYVDRLQPPPVLTDRDRQAWRTLVDELEAVDSLTGEIPFASFHRLVSEISALRTAERFSARLTAPGIPRIRIMPPRALGYRPYRWIFAPGFADGEIPAPGAKNPLLPNDTLDALNRIIWPRRVMNSKDRNRREPLYFFMLLDSATEQATLTFPGSTLEGEPIYPSIYIGEIRRHYETPLVELAPAARPRDTGECFRDIARAWRNELLDDDQAEELLGPSLVSRVRWERRGIHRADLGSGFLPVDVVFSPSELNVLDNCPFIFLARHRLRIRSTDLPDFEVPPAEVGNLAHRILRDFYSQPVPEVEEQAAQRMQAVIERQLAQVDVSGQGPSSVIDPSLWKIRRPQLVRALMEYVKFAVRDVREGYETLPEYLDKPLPSQRLGEAVLAGRPDHVGVRRTNGLLTGIRIDDFKYSAASSMMSRQLQESFQIPVYAHLATKALEAEPGVQVEGRYLLLRSPSNPVVLHQVDTNVLEDVRMRIDALIAKVKSGKLHPDPQDRQGCNTCDYRRLCRMYGG